MSYDCKLPGDCDYPCACPESRDEGTVFIERLEDGTVQLKVWSPGAQIYSFVNLTWDEWSELRALDPAPNEPTIAF